MATKVFNLTLAAYQDLSEGAETAAFRLAFRGQRTNAIRLHRGAALPDPETEDYEQFAPPMSFEEETQITHNLLSSGIRLYARADKADCRIAVHRT